MYRPRLFIGSSSEGKHIARALQEDLADCARGVVWDQGFSGLSKSILQNLHIELSKSDAAAFVFSPDDVVRMRKRQFQAARDNVIFEAGMWFGRYGPDRTFLVAPSGQKNFHFPSDLLGLNNATYIPPNEVEEYRAAVGPASNRIRECLRSIKSRVPFEEAVVASDLLSKISDNLFVKLAISRLSDVKKAASIGEVQYRISDEPGLLRTSMDIADGSISAVFYVGSFSHLNRWTEPLMISYLAHNAKVASRTRVRFRRLFLISSDCQRNF